MNKSIVSVFGAFISLCGIVVFIGAFIASGEPLCAILAVISAFGVVCAIVGCFEDTKIADKLSNLFAGEEGKDE